MRTKNGEKRRIYKFNHRKSSDQLSVLKEEYLKNPMWSKKKMHEIAERTNLTFKIVYKWLWHRIRDQKFAQVSSIVSDIN
jgi:hypothetical protein